MKNKLFIITDSISSDKDNKQDNIDLKSIPEELSKYTEVILIARYSKKIGQKN